MIRRAVAIISLTIAVHAYAKPPAILNDDGAVDKAIAITQKYQLTTNRIECLQFDTFDEGAHYIVRVREIHINTCGGASNVSPTLFFLKIRKSDGRTLTNAYADGSRYVLQRPAVKK